MRLRRGPRSVARASPPIDDRQLRLTCEARIQELALGEPLDVVELCAVVERRRGRRLRILPKPENLAGGPCGLWLCTATEDVVFVDESTSELHQRHILLHEIGHLLCDHSMLAESDDSFVAQFFPDLGPLLVQWTLSRHEYVQEQEREAELLATLLMGRAQWAAPATAFEHSSATTTILHALEGRRR